MLEWVRWVIMACLGAGVLYSLYCGVPWIHSKLSRYRMEEKASRDGVIVLTFDDGPSERVTPQVLQALRRHKAKATFFLLGERIPGREAIVRQIVAEGHQVGSHGQEHVYGWTTGPMASIRDIRRGWATLDHALGSQGGRYAFRPPYGKLNLACLLYLWAQKTPIVYWTLDCRDTWPDAQRDAQAIRQYLAEQGGVALLHDFDRTSVDRDTYVLTTMQEVLSAAEKDGHRLLTWKEFEELGRT